MRIPDWVPEMPRIRRRRLTAAARRSEGRTYSVGLTAAVAAASLAGATAVAASMAEPSHDTTPRPAATPRSHEPSHEPSHGLRPPGASPSPSAGKAHTKSGAS